MILIFTVLDTSPTFIITLRSAISLHMLLVKQKSREHMSMAQQGLETIDNMDSSLRSYESSHILSNEKYNEVVKTAEVVLQVMKNRDCVETVRVLGIKCTSQISIWIVSTLFIFTVAIVQIVILGIPFYGGS